MNETTHDVPSSPRGGSIPRALTMAALLLASVGLVALGGVLVARSWKPRTLRLRMVTDLALNQALLGKKIAAAGRAHGLEVEPATRPAGALEALERVDRRDAVDIALVAGGVARRDYPEVRQVTALAPMLLHLLVRAELADGGLARLKGRRINLGPPATATNAVSRDVLAFAGFRVPEVARPGSQPTPAPAAGDFVAVELSSSELERRIARIQSATGEAREAALRELPDAAFQLSPLPSIIVRDLVAVAGFRLVPLPFAEAYCLDRLSTPDAAEIRVDRASFAAGDIPSYTYGIDPAVPASSCRTVATRLILIAHAAAAPDAISRLLETIHDGPVARLAEPLPLRSQSPLFAFHAGSELYMRRNEPFLTPEMLAGLGKAGGGLGALVSGVIAFLGFMRIRQLRRFEAYYHEVRRIELVARGIEADRDAPSDPAHLRDYLEGRLVDLKCQALADFAEGGLKGEGLIAGIISLVNDTRASLARLGPGRTTDSA